MRETLFLWIPKTAGTSIFKVLAKHGCQKLYFPHQYKAFDNHGSVTFGHMSLEALVNQGHVSRLYIWRAFKFCFVRNPLDRMVSLYHYRHYDKKMPFTKFCMRVCQGVAPVGLYNSRGLSQANPQTNWFRHYPMDFVGRFENLEADVAEVFDRLGIKAKLPHANKSVRKPYRSYYTSVTKHLVRITYARDIKGFGYRF